MKVILVTTSITKNDISKEEILSEIKDFKKIEPDRFFR
jgi:hypothetical protein